MSDLIAALQILLKYGNPQRPTHCEHDVLLVDIDPDIVSAEDMAALEALGFYGRKNSDEGDGFYSYRFGRC